MSDERISGVARGIVDANHYLTLATADADGRPWACPVWYAHDGYATFFWASRPGARHSLNIGARPAVSAVIFDSSEPPGDVQAVYLEGVAEEIEAGEAAVAVYSGRTTARGLGAWRAADLTAPAQHRLYRARMADSFVLDGHDRRVPVAL
ncbi:pyridoxamine 5'-phosphate oxidase family protein [Actinoplanes sp. NPDC051411]|uniref:pyridoxamine 5'-phosphate oxidase family protein n=1 Tax=Actinoplanes sp. NPDC051411 TaxID=3155522 RepID=UPI00341A8DF1